MMPHKCNYAKDQRILVILFFTIIDLPHDRKTIHNHCTIFENVLIASHRSRWYIEIDFVLNSDKIAVKKDLAVCIALNPPVW